MPAMRPQRPGQRQKCLEPGAGTNVTCGAYAIGPAMRGDSPAARPDEAVVCVGEIQQACCLCLPRMNVAPPRVLQSESVFYPEEKHYSRLRDLAFVSNRKMLQAFYFALAFCAAQRLRCASAIFLRASALSTRFFLGLALAGDFLALLPALVVAVPMLASSLRACESRAISESIWASMFSIAIYKG